MFDKIDYVRIARNNLEKISKDHTGISSYGCVSEDGKIFTKLNYACHAMCQGEMSSYKAHIMFSVTGTYDETLSIQDRVIYFSWLCSKDSPFAEILCNEHNSDTEYVARYGVIITNLEAPRNLMVAAFAATRACKEHPQHIRMWLRLIQNDINPRFAFFLAGMATVDEENRVYYGMRTNTNHWPLWPTMADESYILNFLKGVHCGDKPFNVYNGYAPYDKTKSVGGAWWDGGYKKTQSSELYLGIFKGITNSQVDTSGFEPMSYSQFDKFLNAAKTEQRRLYDKISA